MNTQYKLHFDLANKTSGEIIFASREIMDQYIRNEAHATQRELHRLWTAVDKDARQQAKMALDKARDKHAERWNKEVARING